MWLYFTSTGTLARQLIHGTPPRQGVAGTFELFAFFKGVDLNEYSSATIAFERPDGTQIETVYFMEYVSSRKFTKLDNETNTFPFEDKKRYSGYSYTVNDPSIFSQFGMYQATIRLYNGTGHITSGLISIFVSETVTQDNYDISISQFEELQQELAKKQNKLPEVIKNRYLHTNTTTGDLEWSVAGGEGAVYYGSEHINISTENVISAVGLQNTIDAEHKLPYEYISGGPAGHSYVISLVNNPVFNNQSITLTIHNFITTIEGTTIEMSSMKYGDIIFVKEGTAPSRWVSQTGSLEVVLTALSSPNAVTTDTAQTISGAKTFSSNITLTATPSDNSHVATKGYVDTAYTEGNGIVIENKEISSVITGTDIEIEF